jgi:hypothetical protein
MSRGGQHVVGWFPMQVQLRCIQAEASNNF